MVEVITDPTVFTLSLFVVVPTVLGPFEVLLLLFVSIVDGVGEGVFVVAVIGPKFGDRTLEEEEVGERSTDSNIEFNPRRDTNFS